MIAAYVSQAAGKEDGKNPVFANGLMERNDQVLFRDRAFLEVLFHQLVFAFGYQLNQGLMCRRSFFAQPYRYLGKPPTPSPVRLVDEGLHRYQAPPAAEVGILSAALNNRQLNRYHLAPKTFPQGVESTFAIGARVIHL